MVFIGIIINRIDGTGRRIIVANITGKCLLLVSIVIVVFFALTGCDNNSAVATETGNIEFSESEKDSKYSSINADIDESNISNVNKETEPTQNDAGGAVMGLLKYRTCYYNVPKPFADLIDKNTFDEWFDMYLESYDSDQGYNDGMAIKAFILHFNISREQFDKANLKLAQLIKSINGKPCMDPKDYANQETDEVFNGDIIYTFDDEIINAYYMGHPEEFYPYWDVVEYKEALREGYTPRTTEWIDVDQMEAEIIAKYGSVD